MKMSTLLFDTGDSYNLVDIFDMAEKADQCGFERFWLGEHFDSKALWSNPEPLIPVILGLTENINVGCAGIILRLHSTLRVASSFKLINAMYPDRVDLGLAAGFTGEEACKLLIGKTVDEIKQSDFFDSVKVLRDLYDNETSYIENNVYVNPLYFSKPNLWLLSLGFGRMDEAVQYGLNYSKSIFHTFSNNTAAVEELKVFKQTFFDKYDTLPQINIAFAGVLTNSEDEAKIKREEERISPSRMHYYPNLIGTADYFEDKLNEYSELYDVDDFTFLDMTESMSKRIENIEEISEKLNILAPKR